MGWQVVVRITRGRPDFGPWELIPYGEFDGRRPRNRGPIINESRQRSLESAAYGPAAGLHMSGGRDRGNIALLLRG